MSKQIIEVKGDTLDEAREQIKFQIPNPDKPEPKRYKVGRSQNLRKPNNHEGSLRQADKLSVLKHSIYLVRY